MTRFDASLPTRYIEISLPTSAPPSASKYDLGAIAVPRFAQFLRKTHLDELPQLFLVPLGYLSLVGPRPEMPSLHHQADPAFAAERVQVRPGCTGLWQISSGVNGLIWESPQFDRFYLRNQSLALDLWVMGRTVLGFLGLAKPIQIAAASDTIFLPERARATSRPPVLARSYVGAEGLEPPTPSL